MDSIEELILEQKNNYKQSLMYLIGKGDSIIEFATTPLFLNEFECNDIDRKRINRIIKKMEGYVNDLKVELEVFGN